MGSSNARFRAVSCKWFAGADPRKGMDYMGAHLQKKSSGDRSFFKQAGC